MREDAMFSDGKRSYLFTGSGLDGVECSMFEPVAVVQILRVEQLGKRMNVGHSLPGPRLPDGSGSEEKR